MAYNDSFDIDFLVESDCSDQSDDCDSKVLVSDKYDSHDELSSEGDEYEACKRNQSRRIRIDNPKIQQEWRRSVRARRRKRRNQYDSSSSKTDD